MRCDAFESVSRRFGAGADRIPVQVDRNNASTVWFVCSPEGFPTYAPLSRFMFLVAEQRASNFGPEDVP
jgi:hypothetical protein